MTKSGFMVSPESWSCDDLWHVSDKTMPAPERKPCSACELLRDDYAKNCKQMLWNCPSCGRAEKNGKRPGRCSDNWHSFNCSIVYM